ncbi:hypothetical protein QYH69_21745 [Paraburkholderia sp. SARCC-3016]|uniref:hypothetical protein n=1 Tax=Paraburkholderia sp. SARCC-3016 TaxID=3058611 RepID=UPI002808A8C0|nr:hypothetical protein [Paraburkholderia sp. SARCC-3016]MDQ7979867.1 hypothetical protein [Paraburkholderia sp. SARCC-3016]
MTKRRKLPRQKANAGILSWRASDQKKVTATPSEPARPATRVLAVKPSSKLALQSMTASKEVCLLHGSSDRLVESVFRCDLKPSASQKAVLDALFSGPLLLKALLKQVDPKPQSSHEASMFLLRHRRELEPYLATRDRSDSVDLLTQLVIQWGSRSPTVIEIQFSDDCTISGSNEIYVPIPRLGALAVFNESRLIEARYRSRYKPSFALVHSSLGYLIEIVFLRREETSEVVPYVSERLGSRPEGGSASVSAKKREQLKTKTERIEVARFVALFGALDRARAAEAKVGKNFVRPDFGALEGRAVQGGLPSLGKRRR